MTEFDVLRRRMVDNQIRTEDVTDHRVLAAFLEIPREMFVGSADRPFAYADRALPCSDDGEITRMMLPPALVARLVQALQIDPGDVVLDIGCGAGYQAAILARLAGSVVAVETTDKMVERAEQRLAEIGIDNVAVVSGALESGYAPESPYDAILIAGGVEFVPKPLLEQLNDGGRLIAVERTGTMGRATLYMSAGGRVTGRPIFDAAAPLLPGFARPPEFVF